MLLFEETVFNNTKTKAPYESLKRITGGDTIPVEYKHSARISKVFNGVVIICGQERPVIADKDFSATSRRLVVVPVVKRRIGGNISEFAETTLSKEAFIFSVVTLILAQN